MKIKLPSSKWTSLLEEGNVRLRTRVQEMVRFSTAASSSVDSANSHCCVNGVGEVTFSADTATIGIEPNTSFVGKSVAADSHGNFVVAWIADAAPGMDSENVPVVCFQRYDAEGDAIGPPCKIDTVPDHHPLEVAVAVDVDGAFAIVWASRTSDCILDTDCEVIARCYDHQANPQLCELILDDVASPFEGLLDTGEGIRTSADAATQPIASKEHFSSKRELPEKTEVTIGTSEIGWLDGTDLACLVSGRFADILEGKLAVDCTNGIDSQTPISNVVLPILSPTRAVFDDNAISLFEFDGAADIGDAAESTTVCCTESCPGGEDADCSITVESTDACPRDQCEYSSISVFGLSDFGLSVFGLSDQPCVVTAAITDRAPSIAANAQVPQVLISMAAESLMGWDLTAFVVQMSDDPQSTESSIRAATGVLTVATPRENVDLVFEPDTPNKIDGGVGQPLGSLDFGLAFIEPTDGRTFSFVTAVPTASEHHSQTASLAAADGNVILSMSKKIILETFSDIDMDACERVVAEFSGTADADLSFEAAVTAVCEVNLGTSTISTVDSIAGPDYSADRYTLVVDSAHDLDLIIGYRIADSDDATYAFESFCDTFLNDGNFDDGFSELWPRPLFELDWGSVSVSAVDPPYVGEMNVGRVQDALSQAAVTTANQDMEAMLEVSDPPAEDGDGIPVRTVIAAEETSVESDHHETFDCHAVVRAVSPVDFVLVTAVPVDGTEAVQPTMCSVSSVGLRGAEVFSIRHDLFVNNRFDSSDCAPEASVTPTQLENAAAVYVTPDSMAAVSQDDPFPICMVLRPLANPIAGGTHTVMCRSHRGDAITKAATEMIRPPASHCSINRVEMPTVHNKSSGSVLVLLDERSEPNELIGRAADKWDTSVIDFDAAPARVVAKTELWNLTVLAAAEAEDETIDALAAYQREDRLIGKGDCLYASLVPDDRRDPLPDLRVPDTISLKDDTTSEMFTIAATPWPTEENRPVRLVLGGLPDGVTLSDGDDVRMHPFIAFVDCDGGKAETFWDPQCHVVVAKTTIEIFTQMIAPASWLDTNAIATIDPFNLEFALRSTRIEFSTWLGEVQNVRSTGDVCDIAGAIYACSPFYRGQSKSTAWEQCELAGAADAEHTVPPALVTSTLDWSATPPEINDDRLEIYEFVAWERIGSGGLACGHAQQPTIAFIDAAPNDCDDLPWQACA